MKTFTINGVPFEFDDSKQYFDFYIDKGQPLVVGVDFGGLLSFLQQGKGTLDEIKEELVLMDRWIVEAPRKRFYRGLILQGAGVLSGEYFFDHLPDEKAEELFTNLENTGLFARRMLETFFPQLAERCKAANVNDPHPATRHYIDP